MLCGHWSQAGADEALMLDPHGFVATCNSVNFFIVRQVRRISSAAAPQPARLAITADAVERVGAATVTKGVPCACAGAAGGGLGADDQVPAARRDAADHPRPLRGVRPRGAGAGLQPDDGVQRAGVLRHGHLRGRAAGGGRRRAHHRRRAARPRDAPAARGVRQVRRRGLQLEPGALARDDGGGALQAQPLREYMYMLLAAGRPARRGGAVRELQRQVLHALLVEAERLHRLAALLLQARAARHRQW
eukprot:scaffold935_cov334-Prasinococcus_capsulatus_cf.AAC.3